MLPVAILSLAAVALGSPLAPYADAFTKRRKFNLEKLSKMC